MSRVIHSLRHKSDENEDEGLFTVDELYSLNLNADLGKSADQFSIYPGDQR